MKTRKKILLIVGAVGFAIAIGVLFSFYFQGVREWEQLDKELSDAQTRETSYEHTRDTREAQKTAAILSLNDWKKKFPPSVNSIEYGEDLFYIAGKCHVNIVSIAANKPTGKKVGTVTYSVSSFSVKVQGSVSDVLAFIDALKTGDDFDLPWNADIKGVSIGGSQSSITLDIYSYK